MTPGAVVIGRTFGEGQRVTTYMPGTVLAVQVCPPSTYPGDQLSGVFASWRVNLLTPHGWEQVAGWASDFPDAEARARELARTIVVAAESGPADTGIEYLDPIETS